MADICMDTNVLAEFLEQYFAAETRARFLVQEGQHIGRNMRHHINSLLSAYYRYEETGNPPTGILVASTVAFVELARKFDLIFGGRATVSQFAAFVDSPPPFFTIEPLGFDVLRKLVGLKARCWLRGEEKGIEAVDNLHVATAQVREDCLVAATDQKLVAAYQGMGMMV